VPDENILVACKVAESREHLVALLNDAGLALSDVASAMGLSRERARQLATEVDDYKTKRSESPYVETDPGQAIAYALDELARDDDLFSDQGNIKLSVIADRYMMLHPGHRRKDVENALGGRGILTLCRIAMKRLKVEDVKGWLADNYDSGMNSKEVLAVVNKVMPAHKISEITWSRFIRSFGFRPTGRPVL